VNPVTPLAAGYRWPAEWEPHAATWIAWPHNRDTWPGHFAGIPDIFARLTRTIARFEPVHVLAGGQRVMEQAQSMVGELANVTLHDIATNDAWLRDYGPTFLHHRNRAEIAAVSWQFDAWGGKYPPWELDNAAAVKIAATAAWPTFEGPAVLEGGAIDGNGQGVVVTTESCLLDACRNATINRREMERILRDYLSAQHIIWLPGGAIAGDDTDGHVDQLVRFVAADRVVVAVEENDQDPNHATLAENLERLTQLRKTRWPDLKISQLPMPRPIYFDQRRVPASYCNFYLVNGGVIVPQFDDVADRQAVEVLSQLFPHREIVGLPARQLVWGLGAYHCLTQQQPAVCEQVTG
jgi:agmatine deiminase